MFFRQVYDRRLAQYAYVIGCQRTGDAIVVDPMRDVQRYVELAESEGLKLVAVAETHIHADFLSGARELAERGDITVYASDEGDADWKYEWLAGGDYPCRLLKHGDRFSIGNIVFDVLHTPGHTPEHICFLVTDRGGGAEAPMGILTGDFVFVGDVGRPDLLESAAGQAGAMEPSARRLYGSIARFRELPPHLQVWPAHGAGSACGKALGAVPMSTVGYELVANAALRAATGEDAFVEYILDGQPEPPLYFGRMKVQNREGPAVLGKLPVPRKVRDGKLTELCGATGVAVLDTREWEHYAAGHLPGSLHAPLNTQFNTVAGCYVPDGMPIYLIVDGDRLTEAVADLVHVGLDHIVGYATPDMFSQYATSRGQIARVPQVSAGDFDPAETPDAFLLDVRRASEFRDGSGLPGATNIAHTRLLDRVDEVPKDQRIHVYCQTGSRSAYASGLLDRLGYTVVYVDGGVEAWHAADRAGRSGAAEDVRGAAP